MANREIEERRAANLIWNAARDYSIRPEYEAFDRDGRADLYFNNIIGAVYRYYDFDRFAALFHYFQQKPDGALYADLFWLGLENCAFARASAQRPALAPLREEYARDILKQDQVRQDRELMVNIRLGHYRRVLGRDAGLSAYETRLLDAVEFSPDLTTEQVVRQMNRVLDTFFLNRTFRELDDMGGSRVSKQGFRLPWRARASSSAVRQISWSGGVGGQNGGPPMPQKKVRSPLWFSRPNEEALRAYVENCFGASMFRLTETVELEEALCTGNHRDCHLHFTRGRFPAGAPPRGEGKRLRLFVQQQREINRAYFQAHMTETLITTARLTERIRNSILLRLEPDELRARSGVLLPGQVWRTQELHDGRVFLKTLQSEMGNLTVDILLDGSASQREQQARVATQGYIIAESLTRCRIPVRVTSFCSVSGCTVLHILRDYGEQDANRSIFDYTAMGWNRDGLAVRAVGRLMERERCEHRPLIILSDANPNDDQKLPRDSFFRAGRDYSGEPGVKDVAAEVSALRKKGVWVLCVFTGGDLELPAARTIYGKDLARIRSVSWFADTVGRLIQDRIREL